MFTSGRCASVIARKLLNERFASLMFAAVGVPIGANASRFIKVFSCDCASDKLRSKSRRVSNSLL